MIEHRLARTINGPASISVYGVEQSIHPLLVRHHPEGIHCETKLLPANASVHPSAMVERGLSCERLSPIELPRIVNVKSLELPQHTSRRQSATKEAARLRSRGRDSHHVDHPLSIPC